jgi:tRNA nucleotidyltransferase (CCA-adding enzyme)
MEPAVRARDIMSKNVLTVNETTSLMNASIFMENADLTFVPVVNPDGGVVGLISLRDIQKGRKHGKMDSPVKAYMSSPVISAASMTTIRDIERIFYKHKIIGLPIIDYGKLVGMVTRWDYLQFKKRPFEDTV